MKNPILSLYFLLLTCAAIAQQPAITREQWAVKPVIHAIADRYKKEPAIILLDKRRIEYVDESAKKMVEYRTLHRIIHVNDDNGIESFNKIYLGYNDSSDIIDMQARAILPNGTVVAIRKESMKDVQEENGNRYKIFAMEGLEKGAEIEYFYTLRRNLDYFGRESLQGKIPTLEASLDILCPTRLVFQFKGYNCTISVVTDTSVSGKTTFSMRLQDIPGAEEEKYADYEANLQRLEYRLSYNRVNGNEHIRLNTWNLLAQRIHESCETFTGKEQSRAGDLVGDNGWQKLSDDRQKIIAVEDYLKKQFTTRDGIDNENAGNIEWITKNKIASHRGIVRLYCCIFQKLGVEYQIVLTCNRSEVAIDKNFENWNDATDFLIYFPGTRKFLAPTMLAIRYPWINPYWGAENALFCQTTTIGNYTTAIATIKTVPLEDITQSFTRIYATLRIDANFDSVSVDLKQSLGGYLAAGYRAAYALSGPDDQRTMMKEFVRGATNSERIITSAVENGSFDDFSDNKPFIMKATVHSEGLLESAGKNMLLKVGEVIGKQTEMYQEKPRQSPMQLSFPHTLERFIDVVIPTGYTVRNLADISMHYEYQTDGTDNLGFTSDYKMEGDTLKIHVLELYGRTSYPLTDYENFKKVINAAADFNKLTLALEKK
jgi:hypothetical protein